MNQREYRIGPGAASLMLLVVVLSMSVLGMLALMSARSDENLSLRSAEVLRRPKSLVYLQGLKWVAQAKERVR